MESSHIATRRAASLHILLCHGRGNNDVDLSNPKIRILLTNMF
jgi:hypothetical protein